METQSQVGAADHARVVLWFEPARAQMNAPGGQAREPALEFRAPAAVTGHEDHQVGESPRRAAGFPSSNAIFQPAHGIDDDVEVFVFRPTRRTDDDADDGRMDTEPSH